MPHRPQPQRFCIRKRLPLLVALDCGGRGQSWVCMQLAVCKGDTGWRTAPSQGQPSILQPQSQHNQPSPASPRHQYAPPIHEAGTHPTQSAPTRIQVLVPLALQLVDGRAVLPANAAADLRGRNRAGNRGGELVGAQALPRRGDCWPVCCCMTRHSARVNTPRWHLHPTKKSQQATQQHNPPTSYLPDPNQPQGVKYM